MASVLPFNNIKVGGVKIAGPEDFIYGSGRLSLTGEDAANTTADGIIHNYRSALTMSSNFDLRGDKRSVDSGHPGDAQPWPSLGGTISVGLVAARGDEPVEIDSFDGIISVEYDSQTNRSTCTITGNKE